MRIDTLAILLLFGTATLPAYAQNPCVISTEAMTLLQLAEADSGISGTGRNGGDESGIGGTGRTGKDESGLGGTGYSGDDESGIGGTGIYGTITAFGSICVNGLRVHYDERTPVLEDGEVSSTQALAIGQVVAIEATGEGDELEASKVAIQSVLVGTVTSLDNDDAYFTVMDQSVLVPDGMDAPPAAGTRVAVSGMRRGDGTIEASRVSERGAAAPDSASGIARWVDDGVMEVGGVRVMVERASLPDVEDGHFVRASGSWDSAKSTIESATVIGEAALSRATERLSLEGFVQRLPGDDRAWIGGIEIDRASLERVVARSDVPERVRVSGMRDRAGRLRVSQVDRVDRPHRDRAIKNSHPSKIEKPKKPVKLKKQRKTADRPRPRSRERPPERPPRPPRPDLDRPEKIDRPILIDREIHNAERPG